jgi:hypothetical protein
VYTFAVQPDGESRLKKVGMAALVPVGVIALILLSLLLRGMVWASDKAHVGPLSSGKVGKTIEVLGQGFTSSTSVSFNGTTATPSVKSSTYLTVAVPRGATTGFVTVTTSSGTLKSNKKFRVIPSVTSFSPTSGSVGTVVTITGVSLTQTTKVTFGA